MPTSPAILDRVRALAADLDALAGMLPEERLGLWAIKAELLALAGLPVADAAPAERDPQ